MLLYSLIFAGFAVAVPLSVPVIHEERDVSRTYLHGSESRRVDPDAILPIRIALAQSNLDKGYDYLMQVSDPDSKSFGQHWTLEAIHEHFAPSAETREAVTAWLESSGIHRDDILESKSTGWLGIDVPASVAERLFVTEYYESHGANGVVDVGCDKYHIPSQLSNHIDLITPGIGTSSLHKRSTPVAPQLRALEHNLLERRAANITDDLPCGKRITPACIRALYDIPTVSQCHQKNTLGIFEFIDTYDQKDLDLFFKYFAKDIPQGTHPELVSINGATAPTNTTNGGGESIIDFTLAYSLIGPQNITLYQTGYTEKQAKHLMKQATGPPENRLQTAGDIAVVENLLNAVDGSFCTPGARKQGLDCGTTSLTTVLSVSYSAPEINMPFKFAQRACNEYMKLGLKGHTLLFASGDYGPAGNGIGTGNITAISNACIDLKHPQNQFLNGTVFNPQFPASCPYVLSVGATQLNGNETAKDPEAAMHIPRNTPGLNLPNYIDFGSSGGFSNYFKEPSYQSSAVSKYLSNYDPGYKTYKFPGGQNVGTNGGLYALGGRALPDVAANGAYLADFVTGVFGPEFGTSLATPIWASLITLINDERTAKGKGPVGFINPTLYKNTQIFNDITSGNVPGCGTDGFAATPGWDPTTGLGTPNYPELLKVLLALP